MATKKATKKATKAQKAQKERAKRWSDISGEIRVFGEEVVYGAGKKKDKFIRYSTGLGVKNDDGEYSNYYFKVGFPRDIDPERTDDGGFVITITRGFLTFEEWVDKTSGEIRRSPKIVILDYDEPDDDQDDAPADE